MSISSLYIQKHIKKSSMPSYIRIFWKEASLSCYLNFVYIRRDLGTVGLKGDILQEVRSWMPSHFMVFWKEALLSYYCRAKGRYRKKNCSNFENSDRLERRTQTRLFFFIRLLQFSQLLTK